MDDNTNYQEDYEEDLLSDIFPLQEQTSGRKKSHVWDHYETHGIKKHGHVGCICRACGWKRAVGKVCEMVDHLALSCQKVSTETRQIFLQEVRDKNTHPPPKKTKKNNGKFRIHRNRKFKSKENKPCSNAIVRVLRDSL